MCVCVCVCSIGRGPEAGFPDCIHTSQSFCTSFVVSFGSASYVVTSQVLGRIEEKKTTSMVGVANFTLQYLLVAYCSTG